MSISRFHVAGEPEPGGLTQKCERCGVVIVDYDGAMIAGNDARPMFFAAHRLVQQEGNSWIGGSDGATGTEIRNGLCELPALTAAQ